MSHLSQNELVFAYLTALTLFALTVLFELLKEAFTHFASELMRPAVDALFSELTVLGFIGLIAFTISKFHLLRQLSEDIFEEEEEGTELLENIHMILFLVMCLFLLQMLNVVRIGNQLQLKWERFERAAHTTTFFPQVGGSQELPPALPPVSEEQVTFNALRCEFISPDPHKPGDRRQLPRDFNFALYLSMRLATVVVQAVELPPWSWLVVAFVTTIIFLMVLGFSERAAAIVLLVMCYGVLGLMLLFRRKLTSILAALINHNKLPPSSRRKRGARRKTVFATAATDAPLTHPLNPTQPPSHELPVHHHSLFWFGSRGMHIHMIIIRLARLFFAFFTAGLAFFFASSLEESNETRIVNPVILVLGLIPVLVGTTLWPRIIELHVMVTSVELMRDMRTVRKVIREQKTQQSMQMMKLVAELRMVFASSSQVTRALAGSGTATEGSSEQEDREFHGLSPEMWRRAAAEVESKLTMVHDEEDGIVMGLSSIFDDFDENNDAMLQADEVGRLMAALGLELDSEGLNKMMKVLDFDKDGMVSRVEFITWIRCHQATVEKLDTEALARVLFSLFDSDNDGSITISELAKSLTDFGTSLTLDEIGEIMRDYDTDGDGRIDEEELVKILKRHLDDHPL